MVANKNNNIHTTTNSDLQDYLIKLEKGNTDLTHPYLDLMKPFIDKKTLIYSGVRVSGSELIYPLRTLTSEDPIQVQVISSSIDEKKKYKRFFYGTAGTTPVFHIIGEQDFDRASKIILCESLTKASAIYQAIAPEGAFSVLNCGTSSSVVKVADQLSGLYKDKLILCADNDNGKSSANSLGFNKQVYISAVSNNLPICKPVGDFKDWDDWYASHEFARDEIFDCIISAKPPNKVSVNDNVDENYFINGEPVEPNDLATLRQLNEQYSHIFMGGKHKVLASVKCPINGFKIRTESLSEFPNNFLPKTPINKFNIGKAWLHWEGKNFYKGGLGYYPDTEKCPADTYNLFSGWGVKPVDGDVSFIVNFIKDIICGGEKSAYEYLIPWLAHMVQKPMERTTVAVLLKGEQGTGKGTLMKLILKMMGANGVLVNGAGQITGRFQSILLNKLFVACDEVDLTSKYHADNIKSVISEETMSIEMKGLEPEEVKLFGRFVFSGNHTRLLSAGNTERRYLVCTMSSAVMNNHKFWKEINKIIAGDGASKFLYYLLNLDISAFNPFKAPSSKGLVEEKLSNLGAPEEFLYGKITTDSKPFDGIARVNTGKFHHDYIEWFIANKEKKDAPNIKSAESTIGKLMAKCGVEKSGTRPNFYIIPTRETLHDGFAKIMVSAKEDIFLY